MSRDIFHRILVRWLLAVLCMLASGAGLRALAQDPSAVATLSASEVGVGEEVELKIKLKGASQLRWQGSLAVDGLQITGPRMQSAMGFGGLGGLGGEGITLVFNVTPLREGAFTIPPIELIADGRNVRTQPLGLTARPAGKSPDGNKAPDPALGTLEIVAPKNGVFVGESVPIEIRLSVDSRVRWQPEAMPDIPGEGFTKQKLPEPRQEHGKRDGREVDVLVFRTAITPSKAGKIMIGPVEVPYVAQVPRAQRNRPRSIFDMLDDGIFGDPFFAVNQRFRARAEAVELEVKPLPAAGRPVSFSGAVGSFKFEAVGAPKQVKIGDPVTMTLTVSGRGNFDRIEAPVLNDAAGWRSYPPSASFKADDELGTTGTKTFSMAVIPETKKTQMPEFEFSYFDPKAAKYVTVRSEPAALAVTGAAPPAPVPAATPVASEEKRNDAAAPAPDPTDILGIRYDAGGGRRRFEPIYRERAFLIVQIVPMLALLALLGRKLWRTDDRRRAIAVLKREKAGMLARLRGRELLDQEFLEGAARVIQLDAAMVTGRPVGSVDAAFAIASRALSPETTAGVERLFSARAELLYAGMNGGRERLSAEARRSILSTLEAYERSQTRA